MFGIGLSHEFAEKERVLTPLLMAMIVFLLLFFASEEFSQEAKGKAFICQLYLVMVIVLQGVLIRVHDPEEKDGVVQCLKACEVKPTAWFFAKLALAFLTTIVVIIPTSILLLLSYALDPSLIFTPISILAAIFSLFGLATVGTLLALLLRQANGRDFLFPLLYFPLTIPVLLAGMEAGLAIFSGSDDSVKWLLLLSAFNVIFLTLGILFFDELLKE